MHFANATEPWRRRRFRPGPAFSVPGLVESARQVAEDAAFARFQKAILPNSTHLIPIGAQPWHTTGYSHWPDRNLDRKQEHERESKYGYVIINDLHHSPPVSFCWGLWSPHRYTFGESRTSDHGIVVCSRGDHRCPDDGLGRNE